MALTIQQRQYVLPVTLQPFRDEGPQGFLMGLAESNLLTTTELNSIGIVFNYDLMLSCSIMTDPEVDQHLHSQISFISGLWETEERVWNSQYRRYCPQCLSEHGYWKVEWELNFYDVCHHHEEWLVDQCSSCGNKLTWHKGQLNRCSCGSMLHAEPSKSCPNSMVIIAKAISTKIL